MIAWSVSQSWSPLSSYKHYCSKYIPTLNHNGESRSTCSIQVQNVEQNKVIKDSESWVSLEHWCTILRDFSHVYNIMYLCIYWSSLPIIPASVTHFPLTPSPHIDAPSTTIKSVTENMADHDKSQEKHLHKRSMIAVWFSWPGSSTISPHKMFWTCSKQA